MHVECMRAKCETSVLRRCHTPGSDLDMAHGARETRYTPYQGKISPKNVYDSMHANTFNTLTQHAETPIRRSTQLTSLGETRPRHSHLPLKVPPCLHHSAVALSLTRSHQPIHPAVACICSRSCVPPAYVPHIRSKYVPHTRGAVTRRHGPPTRT